MEEKLSGRSGQYEADLSSLQEVRAAVAEQGAQAPGEGEAAGRSPGDHPNERTWAMDYGHDQLATWRKIRVLTIVDTFSRFSPAVDAKFSCRGEDVVLTLERVCAAVGYLATIRVDQDSEFVSRDLDLWAYQKVVILDFSRPGKSTDNSLTESFNGKFRAECLNTPWFMSLDDARSKMEAWR